MKQWPKRSGPDPPDVDLSPAAVKRAILGMASDSYLTLASIAVGIAAGAWALLIETSLFAGLVAAGGIAVGGANVLRHYFLLGDDHAARYLQRMNELLARRREAQVQELQAELMECANRVKDAEDAANQGIRQASHVVERIQRLREVLGEKLSSTELAFGRFSGTTEQVSLAVLDNLNAVVHLLKSISGDDAADAARIRELERSKKRTQAQDSELAALNERRRIREETLSKAQAILRQNEQAVTDLDRAAVAIAEMKTEAGEADTDLETARRGLEGTIRQTRQFSINPPDPLEGRNA